MDIVFLREDTDYMANDEVLKEGYLVHPAFESGISGFWIMVEPNEETISIEVAVTNTRIFNNKGTKIGHLLKNSEYAATALLSKFLNNNEIKYESKEFVAAIYTDGADTAEDFDIYTSDYRAVNYIGNVKGHALIDTPWDLKKETIIPESASGYKYLLRDIENGGMFYFEVSGGNEPASCRSVLVEKK